MKDRLRRDIRRTFFRGQPNGFMDSPEGVQALDDVAFVRYLECRNQLVPWIETCKSLEGASVAEIGCGSGSSTAAIAERAARVVGYDIDAAGMDAARARFEIHGITNVKLVLGAPDMMMTRLQQDFADGADAVLLYAVLEHQTVDERIETLRTCWQTLRSGGLLIVADTPNRLTYFDHHTAMLPFFHMFPHELALHYASRSPRATFADHMSSIATTPMASRVETLQRWGRGVSYHEFELALGDLNPIVKADEYHPFILKSKPVTLEESLLEGFAVARGVPVPRAFFRQSLDVVLQKP